jgi:hypothetical protein
VLGDEVIGLVSDVLAVVCQPERRNRTCPGLGAGAGAGKRI